MVLWSILSAMREVLRSFRAPCSSSCKAPAGDYYFEIVMTGSTSGIYSFEWEEL